MLSFIAKKQPHLVCAFFRFVRSCCSMSNKTFHCVARAVLNPSVAFHRFFLVLVFFHLLVTSSPPKHSPYHKSGSNEKKFDFLLLFLPLTLKVPLIQRLSNIYNRIKIRNKIKNEKKKKRVPICQWKTVFRKQ